MNNFFDISSEELSNIQGLLPAMSAAEMLQKDYPKISFALFFTQQFSHGTVTFSRLHAEGFIRRCQ